MNSPHAKNFVTTALLLLSSACMAASNDGLIGHWKLAGDCKDASGNGHHGVNHGAELTADGAVFDGIKDYIQVPDSKSLRLGTKEFSVAVWVHTKNELDDVLGDILSKYDPATRNGLTLCIQNFHGVTTTQSNHRNVLFGIDAGRIDPKWTACGRPGNNLMVWALCVYDGRLYAGTFEAGAGTAGHVYRYEGGTKWTDLGKPGPANAVSALAVHDGKLYAGNSRYGAWGSALAESPNQTPGGIIYRFDGPNKWTDCGRIGEADAVGGLTVFRGKLYATSMYAAGRGLYRYEGGKSWTFCGNPDQRVAALGVYNGHIYGTGWDKGQVFRYEGGTNWTNLAGPPETSQVYSFAIHQGQMYIGTWPGGSVWRLDSPKTWTPCGQLGDEKEVMGMAVYNSKLYAGTLPLAQVHRYDGDTAWTLTGRLDHTPDVKYRRAWSMAVYQGKLFCGTLPSGTVHCIEAGKCVTYDRALPSGWHHVAAVRAADRLLLYVDGKRVAASSPFQPADYNLANDKPLTIGFGQHDHFNGKLKNLKIYNRSLTENDIRALATNR